MTLEKNRENFHHRTAIVFLHGGLRNNNKSHIKDERKKKK